MEIRRSHSLSEIWGLSFPTNVSRPVKPNLGGTQKRPKTEPHAVDEPDRCCLVACFREPVALPRVFNIFDVGLATPTDMYVRIRMRIFHICAVLFSILVDLSPLNGQLSTKKRSSTSSSKFGMMVGKYVDMLQG